MFENTFICFTKYSFPVAKLMIFFMFKRQNKIYSTIEKNWFLLFHWVAKNSKINENNPEVVIQWCSMKKESTKILQTPLENTGTGVSYKQSYRSKLFSCEFYEIFWKTYFVKHLWMVAFENHAHILLKQFSYISPANFAILFFIRKYQNRKRK